MVQGAGSPMLVGGCRNRKGEVEERGKRSKGEHDSRGNFVETGVKEGGEEIGGNSGAGGCDKERWNVVVRFVYGLH